MKIDTGNLNPGTWFDFPDGTGRVCLRTVAFEDAARIRKATTKVKAEYKNGGRFEFEETDDIKAAEMTWDACIVDWKGLEDAEGTPIPCTTEWKIRLMKGSPVFGGMIKDMLEKLKAATAKAEEDEEKNS